MASKQKRANARAKKRKQKYSAKVNRITRYIHDTGRPTNVMTDDNFQAMIGEFLKLNLKHLQTLLTELNTKGAIPPWYGDYHRMLIHRIEIAILERTMLQ